MKQELTDSQLVILSAASNRSSGAILPLPPTLTLNKGSAALVLKSLASRGLVAEHPAGRGDEVWRECEDGSRVTLKMTEVAFGILGIETGGLPADELKQPSTSVASLEGSEAVSKPLQPGPGTKLAILLGLLRQTDGATLEEMIAATGWQAHSIRGAISSSIRKKLGVFVETVAIEGRGRVYRTAGPDAAPGVVEASQ